ncbi:FAD dependent oxidoreductase-domain-containing protein [Pleurostoma richardsiae]|uniref:FAD dependent oxidoreductase-domain-containing protein n=1 Tax=Pleurostoma richardsiae TaxID=41990 RepID=A0AA38VJN1_9PEZI|nr:FAD dependent oxidoreductase-domain-containing protein [Pleurostoma richardsiae]
MTPPTFGFPKENDISRSCWLLSVEGDPLLNHVTTPKLPSSADIVVIGSGMSGTLVAKHCIDTWPEKSVVVLEAREFCSGATGRNAGHCKPDQWRGFADYERAFGTQQALKILENEQQTWSDVVAYVKENHVDCDLWVGDTLDVPVTPEAADKAKNTFERFKAAGGKVDHIKVTQDRQEAAELSRVKDAQACYAWPASTLHPWKLAAHVMRENLKKSVNLQTHTRVNEVVPSPSSPDKWVALKNSYGVLFSEGGLISINPRITMQGSVLFGGSNPGQPEFEKWLHDHPERCIDDGLTDFKSVSKAVQDFAESQFTGWPPAKTPTEFHKHSWSGIIALSMDGVPFVGELPGLPGQWICAGHNGQCDSGMARIFTAAPGLVRLMGGRPWADTNLPDVYQITPSRIAQLQKRLHLEDPGFPRL